MFGWWRRLNCVANGKILRSKKFENIWIQPAAGDAGGSLGAALIYWYQTLQNNRNINPKDSMKGSFLGPNFSESQIEEILKRINGKYIKFSDEELINIVAKEINDQKIVGWFQGRMEFGPRALGSRSILADPRSEHMQKNLNLKIKFRESFRPFAPSILIEDASSWFELDCESPYMLLVSNIKSNHLIKMSEDQEKLFGIKKLNIKRSLIPSVTHVDYSARIQTVSKDTNLKYYNLIKKFKELSGVPILINTSFNIRGEPIVCTIEDAFRCFMGTNLDILVCENFILYKEDQDQSLIKDYKSRFELD